MRRAGLDPTDLVLFGLDPTDLVLFGLDLVIGTGSCRPDCLGGSLVTGQRELAKGRDRMRLLLLAAGQLTGLLSDGL